jgi:pyridoxamine 5'-phosphate oxidase
VIEDRDFLDQEVVKIEERFQGQEALPVPDHWGGYLVTPRVIEFWQGRPDRLHDRIRYRWEERHWVMERLAP